MDWLVREGCFCHSWLNRSVCCEQGAQDNKEKKRDDHNGYALFSAADRELYRDHRKTVEPKIARPEEVLYNLELATIEELARLAES